MDVHILVGATKRPPKNTTAVVDLRPFTGSRPDLPGRDVRAAVLSLPGVQDMIGGVVEVICSYLLAKAPACTLALVGDSRYAAVVADEITSRLPIFVTVRRDRP